MIGSSPVVTWFARTMVAVVQQAPGVLYDRGSPGD